MNGSLATLYKIIAGLIETDADVGKMSNTDRQLLEKICRKVDDMDIKINSFVLRIEKVEENVMHVQSQVDELDRGVSAIETEFQEQRQKLNKIPEEYVSKKDFELARKEIIDLSNRSRRKNIILHNVPEGEEEDIGCEEFVQKFLSDVVGMDPVPPVEVAHRSGKKVGSRESEEDGSERSTYPRKITVRCVKRQDKNRILEAAVNALKGHEKNYFITDDIHPYTRNVHNQLVTVMKDMRQKNWFAYIPWTVPRVIKYRSGPRGTPGRLKTYRLPGDITVW